MRAIVNGTTASAPASSLRSSRRRPSGWSFEKFLFYRDLDSLAEYVLVAQDYRQLEVFRRAEQWQATRYAQGSVPLRSVDLVVTLDEIYRRTGR